MEEERQVGTERTAAPDMHESPGIRSLNEALRMFFILLKILMVLTATYFVFSNVFEVKQQNVALVLRFGQISGAPQEQVKKPGNLHWAFPYPIDEIVEIEANRVRQTTVENFWYSGALAETMGAIEGRENISASYTPGKDGFAITGDMNIIHFIWTARYRIRNPVQYFLNLSQPSVERAVAKGTPAEADPRAAPFVEAAVTNSVVRLCGGISIDDILKARQEEFKEEIVKSAQKILDSESTGIELESLDLVRMRVPNAVQDAFDSVLVAENQWSEVQNKAHGYRNKVIPNANAEAEQIIREAEAYKNNIVRSAEADAGYINKLLQRFPKGSNQLDVYLRQYYLEVLGDVMSNVKGKYVLRMKPGDKGNLWLYLGKDPKDFEPEEKKGEEK